MRKLLGFLILLGLIAGGGAYYYLTYVFPEREVVAIMQDAAREMDAEFSYQEIEPGPLGLNGRVVGATFTFSYTQVGDTTPSKTEAIAFDEIAYSLDPMWMLKNIPSIYKLRAITHYKSLSFKGLDIPDSPEEYIRLDSLSLEGIDYTGYAMRLQADPNFEPDLNSFKSLDDFRELFWLDGIAIDNFDMASGGVTSKVDHYAVRDLSNSGIGAIELSNMSMTTPQMTASIESIDIQNLNVPLTPEATMQNPFSLADKFEVKNIKASYGNLGDFAIEEIYVRETSHVTLASGIKLPTSGESGIIGISFPTALFASAPEAYLFFTANEMENLIIDMSSENNMDLDTGISSGTTTLRLRDMAALSFGLNMSGGTRAMYEEIAGFLETAMAAENSDLVLTMEQVADYLKALTDPILKGSSPKDYKLPDLPNMDAEIEQLLKGEVAKFALTGGSIGYEDLSLIEKSKTYFVAAGMTEEQAQMMMMQNLALTSVAVIGVPVAEEFASGLLAMVENPGAFDVDVTVDPAISVGELLALTESDEALSTFLMTDWNQRLQSTLTVYDAEGNEVDLTEEAQP